MLNKLRVSKRQTIILLLALAFDLFVFNITRVLPTAAVRQAPLTSIDDRIPLWSWMVLIYLGSYLFWGINFILAVKYEEKQAGHFLTAFVIGELVTLAFFFLYPTVMVRPEITGTSIFDKILRFVYWIDSPTNLMPSLHCFLSWLCWIGVRGNKEISPAYRVCSFILAAAICYSTLAVKQHVLWDLVIGVILAEVSYLLAGPTLRLIRKK